MQNADKVRFATVIAALAEAFQRRITDGLVEAYWLGLNDLNIRAVEAGVARAIRECSFMPAPAEIRVRCGAMSPALLVEQAWACMLGAIREHGGWRSVQFEDHGITAAVERMGGWERLTGLDSEELLKWGRKDFLTIYGAWQRDAGDWERSEEPATLPGMGSQRPVRIAAPYLGLRGRIEACATSRAGPT